MTISRDFGAEIDAISKQLHELKQIVQSLSNSNNDLHSKSKMPISPAVSPVVEPLPNDSKGTIFYSGHFDGEPSYRWEPQQREVAGLLDQDGDKMAKVLAAIGHKQRVDILKAVLRGPLTGAELVEQLNMGTTGQLYHHTKALVGANLLIQEDRGGRYAIPAQRSLPLLLLLAATSDLLDTSEYISLAETREHAGEYLGGTAGNHDPHHLLLAVLENCIIEHQAGYCSEIHLFIQRDGSVTVSDNGRGIPVQAMKNTNKIPVQLVLTELSHYGTSATVMAPGSVKGINMAVVNALSEWLIVDIRRDGRVYRQDYKQGIPQSVLLVVGATEETGTSVTWMPDRGIFGKKMDSIEVNRHVAAIAPHYPELNITVHD